MRELIESYQRDLIEHALSQTGGVWAKAAEFLQMDRGNLYRMGKNLGSINNQPQEADVIKTSFALS